MDNETIHTLLDSLQRIYKLATSKNIDDIILSSHLLDGYLRENFPEKHSIHSHEFLLLDKKDFTPVGGEKIYTIITRRSMLTIMCGIALHLAYEMDKTLKEDMEKNYWWGYLHTSGSLQVKRYFGALDTDEARESPFCKEVYGPFEAENREEALKILKQKTESNETINTTRS